MNKLKYLLKKSMTIKKQKIFICGKFGKIRTHSNSFGLFAFLIITFFGLLTPAGFAQDCKTQAANKPSTLATVKNEYANPNQDMSASEKAIRKPYLAKAEKWVKNIVANFTGAKMEYFNNHWSDYLKNGTTHKILYQATGIKSYYTSKLLFFAYYCYDGRNTVFTEDVSGSNIQVVFNNVFTNGDFIKDAGVFTINAKSAFQIIQKKRSEGRIDFYEQRVKNNADATMYIANDYIILRNSDKPVFLSITRKEYLEQMLKDVENFKANEIASAKLAYTPAAEAQNKARFDEELKRIDNSKNYTKEQMASYRRRFIETWETEKQKYDKRISRVEKDSYETRQVISEYLKKPTEWLSRSFSDFYSAYSYTAEGVRQYFERLDKPILNGVGEVEEVTQTEIVSINPAYFNKTLGSDVPQLLLVHLQNGTHAHMLKVGSLVKQPNALAPLEAILNSR